MKNPNVFVRAMSLYLIVWICVPVSVLAQTPFYLSPPSFPDTNTVRVTVGDAPTDVALTVYQTPLLSNSMVWTPVTTGTVGQTVFDLTRPTNATSFYLASHEAPAQTLTVATPVFTPGGGSYPLPTNVVVTCATEGAAIYYTTNGNTPTTTDIYIANGGGIGLMCSLTLKAKGFKTGFTNSEVATATYTINCPPTVDAGTQQVIYVSSNTLAGFVTDDGLTGGGSVFTNWSKVSGPGTVTFGNANQTNSTASFGADGIYVLQLSASDGQYTNSSQVAIGVNPTLSVTLTEPSGGSSYTVPTNFLLQAEASSTSGSVTQVLFYAGSLLVGTDADEPFSVEWKSVSVGAHDLRAVAISTDVDNFGLASDPVNITVAWPTNVGQVTLAEGDLIIPVAGLPIEVNRVYDTRFGDSGSFGENWQLDYEQVSIEKSAALGSGYTAQINLGQDCIVPNHDTLVTVSLSPTEKYYFSPRIVFQAGGGSQCVGHSTVTYLTEIQFEFDPLGASGGQLETFDAPNDVGMMNDNALFGNWSGAIQSGTEEFFEITPYEPSFTLFTFIAPDGTRYKFDSSGNLYQRIDRNNNSLTYSDNGVSHNSGKYVNFTRDGNNRVTEIDDPIAINTSGSPALKYDYAGNGNLTNVARLVQRSPAVYENTVYAYTNTGYPHHLTSITDARGIVNQRYEYDSSGRLFKQFDALGNATTFSYDLTGRKQTLTDREDYSTTQTFTDSGLLASVQDAENRVTSYEYDERERRTSETNPAGETTSYGYDYLDHLSNVTNGLNQSSSATYNEFGQVLVSENPACGCAETSNGYDANGNLLFTTNALAIVTAYGYDFSGNRTTETNALGLSEQTVTTYEYDFNGYGYVMTKTDAHGNETTYTYDDNGNRLTETRTRTLASGSPEDLVTTWGYDAANRVIRVIEPDGLTNHTAFNAIAKVDYTVDKLGHTNRFVYDSRGLLATNVQADGLFEWFAYDKEARRTNSVDRAGNATRYSYDGLGRLKKTTYADTSASETIYDAAGRVLETVQHPVNPGGLTPPTFSPLQTRYGYDAAGRRIAITNAIGTDEQTFTLNAYDANGNQTNTVDALGRTNTTVYDALNRQVEVIFPDNTSERYGYDGLDRKIAATNQANVVTRFGYNKLGQLTSVTNAFGSSGATVTRYAFDEVGNQTNQVDALNHTNRFEYNSVGRRTKEVLPGLQSQTFGYDAVGNLIRLTNFNGVVLTNQYDALNRLTNKASVGGYQVQMAYNATGQRTNMVDSSGTTSYTYDSRDRVKTKASPQGTLSYDYDEFGNLYTLRSATANGVALTNSYDSLNRLETVTDRSSNVSTYDYNAVGNLQSLRYPNAVTNTWTYNALSRLTNISVTAASGTLASFAYQLAPAGNRTNLNETISGSSRTFAWQYDPLHRLTNETITGTSPTGTISYKYDAVGNRTNRASSVSGISSQTLSYNSNDWLTGDGYDSNGNTTSSSGNSFAYDVENRLKNYNSGVATYVHDGDGNRVQKTVGSTTTLYLVDDRNLTGYPQVLEELTVSGGTTNLSKVYAYGLDLISQRQSNGTTHYYGHDGNGNVRFLAASNATVSDTYVYDAFGTVIASSGSTPNDYRYTGEQYDANLGFYYLRARYLNPNTGRFWSRDSYAGNVFDPPSLHRYAYVVNNPVNMVDPSGHVGLATTLTSIGIQGIVGGIRNTAHVATLLYVASAVCAAQVVYTTGANVLFNLDTTGATGPCAWRDKSRGRILFHYSALPTFAGAQIWSGTWLTDSPNLTAYQAKLGLGIRGALPTTLYAVRIKDTEIQGGTLIQAEIPIDAREWLTIVPLPLSRIAFTRPIL